MECLNFNGIDVKCTYEPLSSINYIKIPVTRLELEEYNYIYQYIRQVKIDNGFKEVIMSNSGGICRRTRYNSISFNKNKNGDVEILVVALDVGYLGIKKNQNTSFRIHFTSCPEETAARTAITGRKSFIAFNKALKKDKVELSMYQLDDEERQKWLDPQYKKDNFPVPLICLEQAFSGETYDNILHLDIKSAYPYVMAKNYPALAPTIQKIFNERKAKEINKSILNLTYGWLQSKYCGFKYIHISIDCCKETRERLLDKAQEMRNKYKCDVLAYNTDGIWLSFKTRAQRDYVYNLYNTEECQNLGSFNADVKAEHIVFKSAGNYCYYDTKDEPHYVIRGKTNLDRVYESRAKIPFDKWYLCKGDDVITYHFDEEIGYVEN